MDTKEFLITPLYLIVILIVAYLIRRSRYKDAPEGKYFMWGLWAKLIGAIMLGLIYFFYYGQGSPDGDTYSYYGAAMGWANTFKSDPEAGFAYLLDPGNDVIESQIKENNPIPRTNYIFGGAAEELMIRITGVIAVLAFGSYYGIAVIFAFLSFTGVWALYRTFTRFFPGLERNLALAVIFIPSVFFWGSGILKDTIVLGSLGWLTYTVFKIFIERNWSLRNIVFFIVSFWLIMVLKGYVLLAFIPALSFWVLASYKSKIQSKFLRRASTPVFIVLTAGLAFVFVTQLSGSLGRYSLDHLESTAQATQWWHQVTRPEGSVYTLGIEDYSITSLARVVPAALTATYFRPFPWEASGAVSYLTALESLLILMFVLYLLIKTKVIGILRYIDHPFIQFCLVFALVFGFAVGLTSYNFGALARYKIQSMPFFVGFLFMVKYQMDKRKAMSETEIEDN